MSFIAPLLLLLGLLAIPLILLYMLRLRRKEVVVSSTMLWQKLLRDRQANTPWQRLRRNLLLILQLLILALLVLAIARPFLPVPTFSQGNVVVLLDSSASMLATDQAPDRFSVARSEIDQLITELSGQDQMTIIQVGQSPQVLASASHDKSLLRRAISAAQARLEVADWAAALALAAGATQGYQDARIIIVSDGGISEDLPPISAEVIFVKVGERSENLAISAINSSPIKDGEQLFVAITNYGPNETEAILNLTVDGQLYDARRIVAPGEGTVNITMNMPAESGIIEARLSENENDFLSHDDRAWTVTEQDQNIRVLIIGEGNRFLETAYSALPNVQVFLAQADELLSAEQISEFDIIIYDRVPLPEDLPHSNLLIIDSPGPPEGLQMSGLPVVTGGYFENTSVSRVSDNPILQFVDWGNVNVRRAHSLEAPWATTLVAGEGGPLLLSGEFEGRRIGILTFALQESDLPLQIAFPILIANITDWLSPSMLVESADSLIPGDPIVLRPNLTSSTVTVIKPAGGRWTAEIGTEPTIFADTGDIGIYEVRYEDASDDGSVVGSTGHFAVNMSKSIESDISPKDSLKIGQLEVLHAGRNDIGQRELWPWLVVITLGILMIEWWVYHRGSKLPEISEMWLHISRIWSN